MLAISVIVTLQLWRNAQQQVERDLGRDFNARVVESSRRIEQRMLDYAQVLGGVRGLYAASKAVDRDEFHAFVAALHVEENFPGVQSVGWVPMVTAAEKAQHIANIRRQGFPDYAIQPPGQRDLYAVVVYVEPFNGRNLRKSVVRSFVITSAFPVFFIYLHQAAHGCVVNAKMSSDGSHRMLSRQV